MKTVFAVGLILASATPGVGQFTILSDDRMASAIGTVSYTYQDAGEIVEVISIDDQTRRADLFLAFDVTLQGRAIDPFRPQNDTVVAEAWQRSSIAASEIFLSGGVGEAIGGDLAHGEARSNAALTFQITVSTLVHLQYERFDRGTIEGPGYPYDISGAASLSLTGPALEITVPDKTGPHEAHCLAHNLPNCVPDTVIADQMLILSAGEYQLRVDASAVGTSGEIRNRQPVSFMVHIEAIPIPEPSTWLLAAAVSLLALWRVRRHHTDIVSLRPRIT